MKSKYIPPELSEDLKKECVVRKINSTDLREAGKCQIPSGLESRILTRLARKESPQLSGLRLNFFRLAFVVGCFALAIRAGFVVPVDESQDYAELADVLSSPDQDRADSSDDVQDDLTIMEELLWHL